MGCCALLFLLRFISILRISAPGQAAPAFPMIPAILITLWVPSSPQGYAKRSAARQRIGAAAALDGGVQYNIIFR